MSCNKKKSPNIIPRVFNFNKSEKNLKTIKQIRNTDFILAGIPIDTNVTELTDFFNENYPNLSLISLIQTTEIESIASKRIRVLRFKKSCEIEF